MELGVIMFGALFTMLFAQLFLARLVELAMTLVEKSFDNIGNILMLPVRIAAMVCRALWFCFVATAKGLQLLARRIPTEETRTIRTVVEPIVEVTPHTLQHLRNQRFLNAQPKVRSGLVIEHDPH